MKYYIIYHADCMDGMAAAWIARINLFKDRLSDNVIPIPAHYGSAFPIDNVESGDIVYILDFSYPREIMIDIANKCNVILLDHHESAIKDLVGIDKVAPGHFYFSQTNSGAGMAWKYFNGNLRCPDFIRMVEDRDLWKFELEDTKAFCNSLNSNPRKYDFSFWDMMFLDRELQVDNYKFWEGYREYCYNNPRTDLVQNMIVKGKEKIDEINGILDRFITEKRYIVIQWGSYVVALYNATTLISEYGNAVCERGNVDFSMSYFITSDRKVVFSLRAPENTNINVSVIAKIYGGGGHAKASGFTLPIPEGLKLLTILYGLE